MTSLIIRTDLDGCDCDCREWLDDYENCSMEECEDPECAENGGSAQEDDDDERSVSICQTVTSSNCQELVKGRK